MVVRYWPGGLSSFLQPMIAACEEHGLNKGTGSPYEMASTLADFFNIDVGFASDREVCLLVRSYLTANPPKPRVKVKRRANGKKERTERRDAAQNRVKAAVITRAMKDAFYESWEWKHKRLEAIKRDGRRCLCCGAGPEHGVRIVVDHIKPLGEFWELRLDLNNLQVLCNDCNMGKGNHDHTDFRSKEPDEWLDESDPLMAQFREIMRQ